MDVLAITWPLRHYEQCWKLMENPGILYLTVYIYNLVQAETSELYLVYICYNLTMHHITTVITTFWRYCSHVYCVAPPVLHPNSQNKTKQAGGGFLRLNKDYFVVNVCPRLSHIIYTWNKEKGGCHISSLSTTKLRWCDVGASTILSRDKHNPVTWQTHSLYGHWYTWPVILAVLHWN